MENPSINLELSQEEYRLILEALLFSASVDISSNWYFDEIMKLKDLVIKLRKTNPKVLTQDVKLMPDEKFPFHDEHTTELSEYFPEIPKKSEEYPWLT